VFGVAVLSWKEDGKKQVKGFGLRLHEWKACPDRHGQTGECSLG